MKRFFALFLVLVFVLTAAFALTSCKKDKQDDGNDVPDDGDLVGMMNTTAASTTDASTTVATDDKTAEDYTWTDDANGTAVYVRVLALNVRKDANYSAAKAGEVKFGESYTRVKYNDEWTVISYKGNNCYVATRFLTTDSGAVTFDKVEDKTMYIDVNNTLFLRNSPYFETNTDGSRYEDNIILTLKRGAEVKQTGISKNGEYAKITFTYTDNADKQVTVEGYCHASFLSENVPSSDPAATTAAPITPAG